MNPQMTDRQIYEELMTKVNHAEYNGLAEIVGQPNDPANKNGSVCAKLNWIMNRLNSQ